MKIVNFKKKRGDKLPRFMIAENPIIESGEFILHLRYPKMLIKVYNLTDCSYEERENFVSNFNIGGSCEVLNDYYYFIPVEFYDDLTKVDVQMLNADLANLMKRVADWFISYVLWEEENSKI